MWISTKTYDHSEGLSAAFRQWRATSHCNLIHGYALKFRFEFESDTLDDRNWVQDFGSLKELRQSLHNMFDHTLVVAADDPKLDTFLALGEAGLADIRVLPLGVGCERFAEYAYNLACARVDPSRVRVRSVECSEHGGNSAIYVNPNN